MDFLSAAEALKLSEGQLVVQNELLHTGTAKEGAPVVEERKKEKEVKKEAASEEPAKNKIVNGGLIFT